MPKQSKQSRGFTLIEMICVVLILAIAAVIVIPQLGSRGDLKAGAAARTVMADFVFAQDRAIARQAPVYITFNLAAKTYTLLDGSPLATLTNPVSKTAYVRTFGGTQLADVTLASASFDNKTTIAFDEVGAPYAYDTLTSTKSPLSSGKIGLASEGYTMSLNVQTYTGDITITTP